MRKDIPEKYAEVFLAEYTSQTSDAYTLEDIHRTQYHTKTAEPDEVFSFMEHLIPCRVNTFLSRKG